jgi:hypothetical protein
MTKKFISFPKIGQFRNTVQEITKRNAFEGLDENNEPIYNYSKPKPTLTFTGTVKLHGTNASVAYNFRTDELWAQSRNNIITPEQDNAGFAFFVESNRETFLKMFEHISPSTFKTGTQNDYVLVIYGEWAGKGIQKSVGISEIEKSFFIFDVKKSEDVGDGKWESIYAPDGVLYDLAELDTGERINHIVNFPTWTVDIDFNEPASVTNLLVELTNEVESECPVAKEFGHSGIGEGIVWSCRTFDDNVYRFKVKGEKHSVSKVKKLAEVDPVKLENVKKFVDYAVTENRLNQGIKEVFDTQGLPFDRKSTGAYLNWVKRDVLTEELDVLSESGIEPKDVINPICTKARKFFFEKIDQSLGV